MKKIIAIDFDGTITKESVYPQMGEMRQDAIKVIKELSKHYILCLWTCRSGSFLVEAINALKKNGVKFDYINNSPITPPSTRKIIADYYIDDRVITSSVDWKKIRKELLECIQ